MKPVEQELPHNPDAGVQGDCFRATIASLLELPIAEVPHFMLNGPDIKEFNRRTSQFLAMHGLFELNIPHFDLESIRTEQSVGDIWHGISGPSPRFAGERHAVVGRNGAIVHDPHPDKTGLAGDPVKDWEYFFLVRLNGDLHSGIKDLAPPAK